MGACTDIPGVEMATNQDDVFRKIAALISPMTLKEGTSPRFCGVLRMKNPNGLLLEQAAEQFRRAGTDGRAGMGVMPSSYTVEPVWGISSSRVVKERTRTPSAP